MYHFVTLKRYIYKEFQRQNLPNCLPGFFSLSLFQELRETLRLTTQERDEAMSISEELEAELAKMRGEDGPGRRWREEAEEKARANSIDLIDLK